MRNITVDGCDYALHLNRNEDGWYLLDAERRMVAEFTVSNVCEGVEYAYYCSDGGIVEGVNTEMYYDDWMPERIASWLVSTHPES